MSNFIPHLTGVWIADEALRAHPGAERFHGRVATIVTEPAFTSRAEASGIRSGHGIGIGFRCEIELGDQRVSTSTDHLFDAPSGAKAGDTFSPELDVQGDTDGVACGEGYEVEFSGMCPVQGDGVIDGHPCYYRARGSSWSLEVYPPGPSPAPVEVESIWSTGRTCYVWPDAGYLRAALSVKNIERAVLEFRARKASAESLPPGEMEPRP